MSRFDLALPVILKIEGLYSDNPNDPGGPTKYGVSLRWLKSLGDLNHDGFLDGDLDHDGTVDVNDIKALTPELAGTFYCNEWWDKYGYQRIDDQTLATKLLSFAIHMGTVQAHKLLQRACWSVNSYESIADDGRLGTQTLQAVNASPKLVLPAFRSEAAGFYREIITLKPKLEENRNGWLKRAYM